MKKRTFKHTLFNAKTSLKNFDNWVKLHQQKIHKKATAVGLMGAAAILSTTACLETKHKLANHRSDHENAVVTEVVSPTADTDQTTDKIEQEKLVAALREIISKMDLTDE